MNKEENINYFLENHYIIMAHCVSENAHMNFIYNLMVSNGDDLNDDCDYDYTDEEIKELLNNMKANNQTIQTNWGYYLGYSKNELPFDRYITETIKICILEKASEHVLKSRRIERLLDSLEAYCLALKYPIFSDEYFANRNEMNNKIKEYIKSPNEAKELEKLLKKTQYKLEDLIKSDIKLLNPYRDAYCTEEQIEKFNDLVECIKILNEQYMSIALNQFKNINLKEFLND